MGKKYISILLAVALALTICATGVQAAEAAIYTFEFDGMIGKETAQFELFPDGVCKFSLPGNPMLKDIYAGTFIREGDTVTVEGLANVDKTSSFTTPGLWDWIVDGGTVITVDDEAGTFAPPWAEPAAARQERPAAKPVCPRA